MARCYYHKCSDRCAALPPPAPANCGRCRGRHHPPPSPPWSRLRVTQRPCTRWGWLGSRHFRLSALGIIRIGLSALLSLQLAAGCTGPCAITAPAKARSVCSNAQDNTRLCGRRGRGARLVKNTNLIRGWRPAAQHAGARGAEQHCRPWFWFPYPMLTVHPGGRFHLPKAVQLGGSACPPGIRIRAALSRTPFALHWGSSTLFWQPEPAY